MSLLKQIQNVVQSHSMLQHPFYKDWMDGKLSTQQLENYAMQYTPFVDAFPRFVSAVHSQCESASAREMLLENLMDEEGKGHGAPHPKLWRDFHASLPGTARDGGYKDHAMQLRDTFMSLCRSSFEEGICALYAYEVQIPKIAEVKIEGLSKNYGISNEKAVAFFKTHQTADVYHSQACEKIIAFISPDLEKKALAAAENASQALWTFLSEVH